MPNLARIKGLPNLAGTQIIADDDPDVILLRIREALSTALPSIVTPPAKPMVLVGLLLLQRLLADFPNHFEAVPYITSKSCWDQAGDVEGDGGWKEFVHVAERDLLAGVQSGRYLGEWGLA